MNKDPEGFILLEVLLSLLIMGSVIIACVRAFSGYTRAVSSAGNITVAAALSQQMLSRIRMNEFTGGIYKGAFEAPYAGFSWEADREAVSGYQNRFVFAVKWNEAGIEKALKLYTEAENRS